ncbi:MAG: carboxypeptidase-like regulatory domain-containing protein [Verrucomicrobiae bacterium]
MFAWLVAGLKSPALDVSVILTDGSPAAGATAVSVTKARFLDVRDGRIVSNYGDKPATVGADGWLSVPDGERGRWVFLHDGGWADVVLTPEDKEIPLKPWQQIQGTVEESIRPKGAVRIALSLADPLVSRSSELGTVYWTCEAAAGDDGSFVLKNVPSGTGLLGLVHEEKTGSQTQRWKDYPTRISVPDGSPVRIGASGIKVRGRLAGQAAPALVALFDRSGNGPPRFGLTAADGAFEIPGMPAGDFRIVIRPAERFDSKFHIQRDFQVPAGGQPLDLGDFPAVESSPKVEIYEQVEYPEGLVERVREAASKQCGRPIHKIWLGQLGHPMSVWGARVTFEPEPIDGTHAVARTFIVQIPSEMIRKFYPNFDTEGYGCRFTEGEFFQPRLLEENVRAFPLATQTLHLKIEEPMDYDTAFALLKAIEAGTWKPKRTASTTRKNKDGSISWGFSAGSGGSTSPDDLPRIDSIRREKSDGPIEVQTRERDFGGKLIEFESRNGEFILMSCGHWVA